MTGLILSGLRWILLGYARIPVLYAVELMHGIGFAVYHPSAVAFVQRMKFWTACHEIGHTFNLAHSWQKSLGAPYGSPWVPPRRISVLATSIVAFCPSELVMVNFPAVTPLPPL